MHFGLGQSAVIDSKIKKKSKKKRVDTNLRNLLFIDGNILKEMVLKLFELK